MMIIFKLCVYVHPGVVRGQQKALDSLGHYNYSMMRDLRTKLGSSAGAIAPLSAEPSLWALVITNLS